MNRWGLVVRYWAAFRSLLQFNPSEYGDWRFLATAALSAFVVLVVWTTGNSTFLLLVEVCQHGLCYQLYLPLSLVDEVKLTGAVELYIVMLHTACAAGWGELRIGGGCMEGG